MSEIERVQCRFGVGDRVQYTDDGGAHLGRVLAADDERFTVCWDGDPNTCWYEQCDLDITLAVAQ